MAVFRVASPSPSPPRYIFQFALRIVWGLLLARQSPVKAQPGWEKHFRRSTGPWPEWAAAQLARPLAQPG